MRRLLVNFKHVVDRASYFCANKRVYNTVVLVGNSRACDFSSSNQLFRVTVSSLRISFRPFVTSKMSYQDEKDRFLKMGLEEKRALYSCGKKYVILDDIKPLTEYLATKAPRADSQVGEYEKDERLNGKVSIFVGDITALEVDAIVNAANNSLRGGGGVDGAIHRGAGKGLLAECVSIGGCQTGDAVITGGYKLPAKYVIHTVGPVGEKPELLKSCYEKSLNVALDNGCRSVAFPCISTGVYGYPNEKAAMVALSTVRNWLQLNHENVTRIIFCLFLPIDVEIYERLIPVYFPL